MIHAAKGAPRRRFRGKNAGKTTINAGKRQVTSVSKRAVTSVVKRPVTSVVKRPVTSVVRRPAKSVGKRPVIRPAKQERPRAKPKSVVKTTVRKSLPKPKKKPAKAKDDPICWDFVKGKCKRSTCKWKHPESADWGPPSRPPQSDQSFQRGGRFGMRSMPQNKPNSGNPYNPYQNALASSRKGNYPRGGSLFNGFSGGSSFNSRAGEEFIEKELSWEQHQDMKLYGPNTRQKRDLGWNRPRNGNSKDQNWGSWDKRGSGYGSKMLANWGTGDKLGKSKSGPVNRANFGIFSSGRKRKRVQDDPYSQQIPMNGNRGSKRWKKTHVDRSKGKIAPLNKRASGASKKGKGGATSKSKKAGAGKKKRPSKGEKGYDLCWNFVQGNCKNGSKCKWKHS